MFVFNVRAYLFGRLIQSKRLQASSRTCERTYVHPSFDLLATHTGSLSGYQSRHLRAETNHPSF